MDVTDYHNFSHIGTPLKKRRLLNIGDLYCNAAECLECGWYVRSRNRHDMVRCQCGNVAVDGGSHYAKHSIRDQSKYISRIVKYNEVTEDVL